MFTQTMRDNTKNSTRQRREACSSDEAFMANTFLFYSCFAMLTITHFWAMYCFYIGPFGGAPQELRCLPDSLTKQVKSGNHSHSATFATANNRDGNKGITGASSIVIRPRDVDDDDLRRTFLNDKSRRHT
jgi:hypothetical protein